MNLNNQTRTWLPIAIYIAGILLLVFTIGSSIITSNATGIVKIATNEPNANVIISQENHQAVFIGKGGSIEVRLKQGDYLISASLQGSTSTRRLHIENRKTVSLSINSSDPNLLPSDNAIGYINFDTLVNNGVSSDQIDILKSYFITFAPKAKSIAIDANSTASGPRDPNTNTPFTINFRVSIDSTTYNASISYQASDSSSISLVLYDQSGKQVYPQLSKNQ